MVSSDAVSPSIHSQPHTVLRSAQAGEAQHDGLSEDSSKPQENCRLDNWTISWEDALRREHEYRNKVKMLQQLAGISESPYAESQVDDHLGSLDTLNGHISQQQYLSMPPLHMNSCPSQKKSSHKKRRLKHTQSQQSSQVGETPMQRQSPILQTPQQFFQVGQNHLPSQMPNLQAPQQSSQVGQIPMPRQTPILQTPNRLLQNFWCHVCKINCGTEANLMLHLHGQKHRMNLSKVNPKRSLLEKGFVWCKECNIPCTNLHILAQHRMGKKHLARIEMLAKYRAQGATAMPSNVNTLHEHQ